MAPSDTFPVGYKFHPRDDELVVYYLYNKVRGTPFRDDNVIPEIDLYGTMDARDIWNNNGGQNIGKDEDLYFFTKLKPASKGTGSRVARTIGSGTWKGETSGAKVKDPKTKETIGFFKRFQYKNTKYPQESGCWIMHEFSLHPKQVMRIKSSPSSRLNDDEYVVCRVRKNFDRKRKADDHETGVLQSQSKRTRMQSENIDESYVTPMSSEVNTDHYNQQQQDQTNINATSTSSSISVTNVDQAHYYYCEPAQYSEVIIQYDIPQQQATATSGHLNGTNLSTRLAEQQHYFVTQAPTVASSSLAVAGPDNQEQQVQSNVTDLPQYLTDLRQYYYDTVVPMTTMPMPDDYVCLPQPNFVVDPTMASSLGMSMSSQEDYLQHNGFVNNVMADLPQYYCSSTQDPSSGTVFSQYDLPRTATTGFDDQPHYFVTEDHQPDYFVADPTMASSLASPSNLDQKHHIMDKDQLPPVNFDYTHGDIMIDLDDLWNN
ncbi:hypothetical protein DVH24_003392 [Malus domestica]|uniref:NAC domain-containing protein n=1 Tax=Malus domestica TaxID=3750 RepID=A0A498IL63_MALDO|nr:hypothetical protein DVH24_003392 [Malus domestica]